MSRRVCGVARPATCAVWLPSKAVKRRGLSSWIRRVGSRKQRTCMARFTRFTGPKLLKGIGNQANVLAVHYKCTEAALIRG
jgi:hypothetical protein